MTTAKKIKLLVFTSYLGSGGAEKHVVRLVNHLNPKRFSVEVVVPNKQGAYEEELLPHVRLTKIGLPLGSISSTLMRLSGLPQLIALIRSRRPDVLFSVMDIHNLIALEAVRWVRHRPRLVLGVQNSVTDLYGSTGRMGRLIMKGIIRHYPRADHIVALSQGVADDLLSLIPTTRQKMSVIYNCGYDDFLLDKLLEHQIEKTEPTLPLLVACGRLEHQKGYPYLLRAFALVLKQRDSRLWIVGQGTERKRLEEMTEQLGISESVKFLGFQTNPYPYMAAADVFVLSSLHEGFGNVLVEAMACGVPVVSTDCPHGPNEIVTHQENGLLVPPANESQLAQAIISALGSQPLREQFVQQGRATAHSFHAREIASQYEQLFGELLGVHEHVSG